MTCLLSQQRFNFWGSLWAVIITLGDAASQLLGRAIPVYYNGKIHHYTRSANESISGASHWHFENGRWPWVMKTIDFLFYPIENDHCFWSRMNDIQRAKELLISEGDFYEHYRTD